MKRLFNLALTALGIMLSPTVFAQTPLSYSQGDLFLAFRATGLPGSAQDYVVNVGQASQYTGAVSAFAVPGLGAIGTDLSATFGATWNARPDVFWSVSGAVGNFQPVGSDPAKTLYATRVRPVPASQNSLSLRWLRQGSVAQGVVTSKMVSLATAYQLNPLTGAANVSTANSSKGSIQATTDANSYASFQKGGTVSNSGPTPGFSFANFNPSIEGDFTAGTAGSILELYRLTPSTNSIAGRFVGTFQLDDNGALTFTPAAPVAVLAMEVSAVSVAEADTEVPVKINRSEANTSVTVDVSTQSGTAQAGSDFTAQTTQVTFNVGETQKIVNVAIANRPGVQGNRSFTVALTNPSAGAELDAPNVETITILEAETAVAMGSATYSVVENDANHYVTVNVVRTGNTTGTSSVTLSTAAGTALANIDFTSIAGQMINFAAGETTKPVNITINDRLLDQGDRSFTANLSAVSNGTLLVAPTSATITISDFVPVIPGTLSFSAANYSVLEGALAATVHITVTRSNGSTGNISVDVTSAGGTASADDYSGLASLTWNAGESGSKSFDLTINPATAGEVDETLLLALTNATAGVSTGSNSKVTIFAPGAVSVSVTNPAANAKLSASGVVTLSGIATASNGVAKVEVSLNGQTVGTVNQPALRDYFAWNISATPEQGLNTITVKATDQFGVESAVVSRSFSFINVRTQLGGNYNGLLTPVAAASAFDHTGLLTLTVANTGAFTGKIQISGVSLPLKGVFLNNGEARFGSTLTASLPLLKASSSLGSLALSIDPAGSKVTGTLKDGAAVMTAEVLSADHAFYTASAYPALPLLNVPSSILDSNYEKGKYTALFQANPAPNGGIAKGAFPQGAGYGQVTVSAAGVVKVVGKLADGSPISYSNALSKANKWPVFITLYGNKGFISGKVGFDDQQVETDASATMTWVKPGGGIAGSLYPQGWPLGIASDFVASKFVAPKAPTAAMPTPPNPDTVLGVGAAGAANAATANLTVTVADGGLTPTRVHDASMSSTSKVTVLANATSSGFSVVPTVTFVAATGALSGHFTHPVSGKVLQFGGVAYQKTNMAAGAFVYTPTAAAPAAVAEVGSVEISLK